MNNERSYANVVRGVNSAISTYNRFCLLSTSDCDDAVSAATEVRRPTWAVDAMNAKPKSGAKVVKNANSIPSSIDGATVVNNTCCCVRESPNSVSVCAFCFNASVEPTCHSGGGDAPVYESSSTDKNEPVNNVNETAASAVLLFAYDRKSNNRFLIDTGSGATLQPLRAPRPRRVVLEVATRRLGNASGVEIPTAGQYTNEFDFGLKRTLSASVIVADVQTPLPGIDFLRMHGFDVDIRRARLVNHDTGESILLERADGTRPPSVNVIEDFEDKRGTALLEEYKDLTNPIDTHVLPIAPEFEFTIDTGNKPPVAVRSPRRLAPDLEPEVKAHYDDLLAKGYIRQSKLP